MRILELDNDEMNRLLEKKRLTVDHGENTSLEIYNNTLTFNDDRLLFDLVRANFEFIYTISDGSTKCKISKTAA